MKATGIERRNAIFFLLIATAFWGLSFPVYKSWLQYFQMFYPDVSTLSFSGFSLFIRFGLGAVVILLWQRRKIFPIAKSEWKQGVGVGVFGGLGTLFQMDALAHTPASVSAFLTQTYVVIIPIFWALRQKTLPGRKLIAACALVMAGIAVLSGLRLENLVLGIGETETLLGSLFFSAQILWMERSEFRGNNPLRVSFSMFLSVAVLMLIPIKNPEPLWEAREFFLTPGSLLMAALLAVFSSTLAYFMMVIYQPKITSTEASFIYCTEPVTASLLALFLPAMFSAWLGINYPNEEMNTALILGGGLIFVANYFALQKPTASD